MLVLVTQIFRKRGKSLLVYIAIAVALAWMMIAVFPSFSEGAEELQEAFASYPEVFLEAVDVDLAVMLSDLEGFLAAEQYSIMWPLVTIVFALSLGGTAIAGEIETGTLDFLLAQPISRVRVYGGKFIAGLVLIALFTVLTVLSVIPLAKLYGLEVILEAHALMALLGFLFGMAIYAVSLMLSSLFSTRARVFSVAAGVLLSMYAADVVASLKESLSNLKYFSFFHYFDHNAALIDRSISGETVLVFLAVSLTCLIVGGVVFARRDIAD